MSAVLERGSYGRGLVEAMVWGEFTGPDGKSHDAEGLDWNRLRSYVERTGNLDGGAVAMVLDLERALLALGRQHPEAASAVVTMLMLQLDRSDLAAIYPRRANPERWINKAVAWMTAYLSGLPVMGGKGVPSCEQAYRSAR